MCLKSQLVIYILYGLVSAVITAIIVFTTSSTKRTVANDLIKKKKKKINYAINYPKKNKVILKT